MSIPAAIGRRIFNIGSPPALAGAGIAIDHIDLDHLGPVAAGATRFDVTQVEQIVAGMGVV